MSKRLRFFIGHFSLSLLIVSLIAVLLFYVWYPQHLATAMGIMGLFWMMLGIDVIIGPILGFIVYKEHKKSLKFDLAVIIVLQFSALMYGVYSLSQMRPIWLVYNNGQINAVGKHEIYFDVKNKVKEEYKQHSYFGPQYVAIHTDQDDGKYQLSPLEVEMGFSVAQDPQYYVPFTDSLPRLKAKLKSLEQLQTVNPAESVQKTLQKYPNAVAYLPLKATAQDMTVLVDKDGQVIKIVDLRPW